MLSQDGSNNMVVNHMVFAMIHCTEKYQTLIFRNGNVFCLYSRNRIHQSMHHALFRPLLARSDNIIISCYSHKTSYLGKHFFKKEVINNRVY